MNKQCQKSRRENKEPTIKFFDLQHQFPKTYSVLFSEFISDDFNSRRPCFFLVLLIRCCSRKGHGNNICNKNNFLSFQKKEIPRGSFRIEEIPNIVCVKTFKIGKKGKKLPGPLHSVRCFTICTSAKVKSTAVLPSKVSGTIFFLILRWKLTIF